MKYALIGCGMICANHIRAALETGLEIVALCDLVEENREKALAMLPEEKRSSVKLYADYRAMLSEQRPALTAVALGSGIKRQIVCECLEAGTNVIVEKPVALSLEDADAMIEAAAKNGVKLCVNHQLRFCPSMRALHAEVADGSFGRLLHGAAQIRRNRNKAYFDAGKWRGTWKNDGGTLMNQCIHYTDLLQWMFGDADEVFAYTDRLTHPYIEAEDMGLALIRFKNGAYATVEGTVNVYPNNLSDALAVFGETGTVSVSGKYLDQVERWQFENGTPGGTAKDIAADMAAREGDGIVACAVLSVAAGIDDAADEVIPDAAAADENGVETCIGCPVGRGGTAAGDAGNGAAGDADQVVTGRAVKQT